MKMQTKDASTLLHKIIQFTPEVEKHEYDFDAGMLARVNGVRKDQPGDDNWKSYILHVDFSEFKEHNEALMQANYYDKDGVPCETWAQQKLYQEQLEKGMNIYIQFEYDESDELYELPFEFAPNQLVPPTVEECMEALKFVQYALAQDRDNQPIEHPEHGKITLEEVKYLIVDPVVKKSE